MNYYNPYFYAMPNITTKAGLFSKLIGNNGITLGGILNGTQRVLNIANQTIPLVKQVKPMVGNAKTMLKVMNEFKKSENPKSERKRNIQEQKKENIQNIDSNLIEKNSSTIYEDGPTFFI